MADVFRRLPLLILIVLLLLLVVLFRVCILGNVPPHRRKRRSSMKDARMEARQAIPRSSGEQVGGRRSGGSLSTVGRASQRVGYDALPPHLQPLADSSDEEEEVERRPQTVSLGSGSTQEWTATELCGTGGGVYEQSFTELLRPGLGEDEGDGRVNLSFGLSTGRSTTPSRTVLVRPHPGAEGGQLTVVDRSARTRALASETAGANRNSSTPQPQAASLSKGAQGRPEWMQLPSPLSPASEVARGRGVGVDGGTNFLDVGNGLDGREVWRDLRRDHRLRQEEYITRGVEHLHVGDRENENETDNPPAEVDDDDDDDDDDDNDVECGEGGGGHASPSLQSDMAAKGGKSKPSVRNARPRVKKGQGKGSGGEGDGDAEEKRNFWSVEHIIALIRAKRDQDAHMQGMGHTYARMKPREWKWQDVAQRLKNVGVNRNAEKCGKKWDNLMQQFKKERGRHRARKRRGGVDARLFADDGHPLRFWEKEEHEAADFRGADEMHGETRGANGVDDGECKQAAMLYLGPAVRGVGSGDGSAKEALCHVRRSQQTHVPRVVGNSEGHSAGRGKAALKQIVEGATPVKKGRHQAKRQRKVVQAVPAGSARDVVEEAVVEEEMTNDDDDFEDDDDEPLQRKARVSSRGGVRINEGGEGTPTARRGGGVAAANQPVFVDVARDVVRDVARRDVGGCAKEGAASHETAQRVLAPLNRPRTPAADVAGSSQAAVEGGTLRSPAVAARGGAVVVPGEAVEVPKGGDGAATREDDEALVHRLRGQRAATHAMDAAAKLWEDDNRFWNDTQGSAIVRIIQEARAYLVALARGVQPPAIRRSISLPHNSIPQHKIEDESELNAAKERALKVQTISLRAIHVGTAEAMDGGRVSYERLKGMAEAMRYLLAATMWIMRMAGDDPRSHYDAWVFVQLTAKTTLLASMNRQFDARRHITQSAQVMTDKLGRPPPTFAPPPAYIPDWASKCGVTFSHDATLASPMEAKRLDWLGTGPPEDDDDDAEGDDKGEGG
ncbi:hypothetical protein CBR_g774 [Chara braunii]|uniref:Myb-like domain-containing protein n=1 Tax=Chara braunii TaxID=69332 RepID=A0A388KCB6_CHABU|nr:hypothetical protein CBR_g774 [Chara braunii]|eukprot:GBG67646.1 hypothetical protein CBR_g774 [Chara braunii]